MSEAALTSVRLIGGRESGSQVRMAVALEAAVLLLIVGNLARIPVFSAGGDRAVPVLVNDVIVGMLVAAGLIAAIRNRGLRLDGVALAGLVFAAIGGASAIAAVPRFGLSGGEVAVAIAFLLRWLVYFAIYIVAINAIRGDDVSRLWRALETTALIFAAFGIIQAALLPDFALMVYPGSRPTLDWDAQKHRLVSTFLDPNYAGALIMLTLLGQLALISAGARVAGWKPLILLAALLLTLSRSSVLATVIGIGCILAARGLSKRLLWLLAGITTAIIAALPAILHFAAQYHKLTVDASALGRLVSWAHEWTVLTEHPIIGIGFNTWGAVQRRHGWEAVAAASFGIEGGLLFIAVLTGIVGLAVYLVMLGVVTLRSRAIWRDPSRSPHERGIAIAIPAVTLGMIVHSLFSNSLLHPLLMEPLWILWALGFAIARNRSQSAIEAA